MPPVRAVVVAAFALIAAAMPSAASAACHTSTPATAVHADSTSDGEAGLAPEIGTVRGTLNASCSYGVDPGLVDGVMIAGEAVFIYVDTDGSDSTGSAPFDGADKAIGTLGQTGEDGPPTV